MRVAQSRRSCRFSAAPLQLSRWLQADSLWIFRRRLVFHDNLLARVPHSKCQPCHSAARRRFTCRQSSTEPSGWQRGLLTSDRLPEVCHRIHSTSSSRLNFRFVYSREARSQTSGPAAVTETSHRGVWSLEIAEECDVQNKQLPVKFPHSVFNESGIKSGKMFVAALVKRRSWEDIRLGNYTFA